MGEAKTRSAWAESSGVTLSPAESRVVTLLAIGHNDIEIAKKLGLTHGTVRAYVSRIYLKVGIKAAHSPEYGTWGSPRVRLVLWWLEKKTSEAV